MVTIFSKKIFLVDLLEGFVDAHNHLLPGIDDGARDIEDSINLIEQLSELGIRDFIATPHIMGDVYPNNKSIITNALNTVLEKLEEKQLKNIKVRASAEYMIDDCFESILTRDEHIPLNDIYILVEMSYLQSSINFDEALKKIASKDLFPIFAHPERYNYLNALNYSEIKNKGVLFQMNLLSLSDYYGKNVMHKAFALLERNMIDFFATDLHHQRHLDTLKHIKVSQKYLPKIKEIIDKTIMSFS